MRHLVEMSGEVAVYAYRNASNLRSQDVSKEILSDLESKDFSHFQYAALEMFKAALNNYSMLKLRFFNQHPRFCNVL